MLRLLKLGWDFRNLLRKAPKLGIKVLTFRKRQAAKERCKQSGCLSSLYAIPLKPRYLKRIQPGSLSITNVSFSYRNVPISSVLPAWPFSWNKKTLRGRKKTFLLSFSQKLKRSFENGNYVRLPLTSERGYRIMVLLFIRLVLPNTNGSYWGPNGGTDRL